MQFYFWIFSNFLPETSTNSWGVDIYKKESIHLQKQQQKREATKYFSVKCQTEKLTIKQTRNNNNKKIPPTFIIKKIC